MNAPALTLGYEELKAVWTALQQFIDNTPEAEDYDKRDLEDPATQRSLAERARAVTTLNRIEAYLVPLMEG